MPIHDVTAHKNHAKPGSIPNDPLYSKEWYIVSLFSNEQYKNKTTCVCKLYGNFTEFEQVEGSQDFADRKRSSTA